MPETNNPRDVGRLKTPEERAANIPDHLKLTDTERQALIDENAKKIAALQAAGNSPFARLSPVERERARAPRLLADAVAARSVISAQLAQAHRRDRGMLRTALIIIESEMASFLAALGRFDEAAAIEPDKLRRAEYRSLWDAVWRDDDDNCQCGTFTAQGMTVHHLFENREVWSVKHARIVSALQCNRCGHLNVRPRPRHLSQAKNARQQARELTKGYGGEAGAQRLREGGLTAANVFRTGKR